MVEREYINPPVLFGTLWSFSLVVIESGVIEYVPLTTRFYILLSLAFICFGIGYFSVRLLLLKSSRKANNSWRQHSVASDPVVDRRFINVVFIAVILLVCLHAYNYAVSGQGSGLGDYRSLITDQGESVAFGIGIALLNPFAFLSLLFMFSFNANILQKSGMLLLLTLFTILSTGRAGSLVILLITGWYLYFGNKINIKYTITAVMGFCLLFVAMGIMLDKISYEAGDYFSGFIHVAIPLNWLTIGSLNVLSYATSGIVAFSEYASSVAPVYETYHTARNLAKVINVFSEAPVEYGILSNILVPFPTNVFSFLFPAYADFGIVGIVVVFAFYGAVGGLLYSNFQNNRTHFHAAVLAIYYSLLTLSIFHDYVFSSLFPYLCFLLLFFLRKRLNVKL